MKQRKSQKNTFQSVRTDSLRSEFDSIIKVAGYYLAIPLYMLGWIFDWNFSPDNVWALLFVRICFSISAILLVKQVLRCQTLIGKEFWSLVFAGLAGFVAFFVTYWNHYSPYYFIVGLNLVGVAFLATIPWRSSFYPLAALLIYGPFIYFGSHEYLGTPYETDFISGGFFIFRTILISIVLRYFNHRLRKNEIQSRISLLKRELELENLLSKNLQAAHDLKSPMSAMQALLCELNKKKDPDHLLDRAIKRVQKISSELLNEKDISLVFKTEPGKPTTLKSSLQSLIQEKKIEYSHRPGLQFHTDLRVDQSQPCPIDPIILERTISNLINNSAQAIENNGRIGINALSTPSQIWITVADNGSGIPEKNIKHILKKGIGTGTGLGLSQAKEWVEAAGGKLRVDSPEGKGTQVSMIFPM